MLNLLMHTTNYFRDTTTKYDAAKLNEGYTKGHQSSKDYK